MRSQGLHQQTCNHNICSLCLLRFAFPSGSLGLQAIDFALCVATLLSEVVAIGPESVKPQGEARAVT